ncbi:MULTISPECIES: HalOD1 output domain-containing protein [Halorussus]|uniref:HalOD1 output domain-containing protein n=1 Tax=Halorussus TaxID=1070314 RepID=UPI00209D128B|nr:HalOD1 output domain-containing protein [Halorussus vallis]USZ76336.1 hypothetical protein NGM07_03170 [Halorussus vallis]
MGEDGDFLDDDSTFTYDVGDGEPVDVGVVRAVASIRDCKPTELPPLHDSVDPDALDALFPSWRSNRSTAESYVTFDYCGYRVTATTAGRIYVEE